MVVFINSGWTNRLWTLFLEEKKWICCHIDRFSLFFFLNSTISKSSIHKHHTCDVYMQTNEIIVNFPSYFAFRSIQCRYAQVQILHNYVFVHRIIHIIVVKCAWANMCLIFQVGKPSENTQPYFDSSKTLFIKIRNNLLCTYFQYDSTNL